MRLDVMGFRRKVYRIKFVKARENTGIATMDIGIAVLSRINFLPTSVAPSSFRVIMVTGGYRPRLFFRTILKYFSFLYNRRNLALW